MSNKSEEELEKERLKNLILFKMYLTDEELTDVAPGGYNYLHHSINIYSLWSALFLRVN